MRDRVFEEHEEQLIDIYDVKVKILCLQSMTYDLKFLVY